MNQRFSVLAACLAAAGILALQGCGGGGGGGSGAGPSSSTASSQASTQLVTGTAAFGAPLANATISLKDAAGVSRTATAGSDGSYTIDVAGLSAPFLMTATGQSGDEVRTYSALVTAAPAKGSSSTVNITPITTAIVALASSTGNNPDEFAGAGALAALDQARLAQARAAIKAVIAEVAKEYGVAGFDPISTPFAADLKSGGDKLLEAVKVTLGDTGVTLTNALSPVASGASGASATVTLRDPARDAPTALPRPTVSTSSANDLLALLRTQLNACLALAPSERIALDASVTPAKPTALKGACSASSLSAFDKSYFSNGTDLLGNWGPRFRDLPQGATIGQAEMIASFGRSDGGVNISARLPIFAEGGGTATTVLLSSDTSGQNFKLQGNQRKYNLGISARLYQINDVVFNPRLGNNYGPDKGKRIGNLSRYDAALQLSFDPSLAAAAKVYAVRVKGPALPAAGLVLARSATCGSGDFMAVYSSDGSLPDATGKTAAFAATASTTSSWRYYAMPMGGGYTGSDFWNEVRGYSSKGVVASSGPATMPDTPTNRAVTPVAVSEIPELPAYTFEVFSVDAPATPEVFTTYMTDKPRGPDAAFQNAWPSLTADSLAYLDPGVSNAKAAPFSSATLNWTLASGAPLVSSASLSGNARDASNLMVRYNLSDAVRPIGAKSITVGFDSETDGLGNACKNSATPVLSATTGSRGIDLRQTGHRISYGTNYSFSGREAHTAPVTKSGGDGWNIYNANQHPIVPGSVVQADGSYAQLNLFTTTGFLNMATAAGGVLTIDSTTNNLATDKAAYGTPFAFEGSDTYPKSLTYVTRVTGNSTNSLRVLDLYTSFVPLSATPDSSGTKSGIFVPLSIGANVSGGGVLTLGGVSSSACSSSPCTLSSAAFDTSAAHTYQVVITLSSATAGTVKVYLDGGATAILNAAVTAFPTGTTSNASWSQIYFGDINTGYQYKSSMDWLIWRTGAFTPADLAGKLPSGLGVTTGY
ncbi:hypothetical protein ACFONG_15005 [Uliginosibacterium paludis]|uniref:Carboxypeptidase regulatory-like domain-containing protein n=1 Tax=Uliginosibacterium paludis TaxID=1615952 RepID=A0ABV2CXB0_9RHOO